MESAPRPLSVLVLRGIVETAMPNAVVTHLRPAASSAVLQRSIAVEANSSEITELATEVRSIVCHSLERGLAAKDFRGLLHIESGIYRVVWEYLKMQIVGVLFHSHVQGPFQTVTGHILIALRVMLRFRNANALLYELFKALFAVRFELQQRSFTGRYVRTAKTNSIE